jgi:uncharacterized protein YciI
MFSQSRRRREVAEQVYVGVYSPGAGWRTGVPVNEQPLFADHGAQMRRLFADGRNLLSGPFADLAGGMAIVRAESPEEAERLLREGDAMVERDVARLELRPWRVAFGADALRQPTEGAVG